MCLNRLFSYCCYVILLVLTFAGLICFTVRSITCCLQERQSSYQCQNFTLFSKSLELELGWLLMQNLNYAVCICIVIQIPEFVGWHEVFHEIIRVPRFWTFMYLLAIAVVECIVILGFHQGSRLQEAVVACFLTENIITVIVICVLNYTQIKKMATRLDLFPRILVKATLFLFCVDNVVMFIIGTTQLSFNVTGLNRKMSSNITDDLETIFGVVRSLANVVFYHKSALFFWQKLFIDKRNILSRFQPLRHPDGLLQDELV